MSIEIKYLIPSKELPLFGKRIIITAPRNYAQRLSQQIIDRGGLPILMPTIETCWLNNYNELDSYLQQIGRFSWIAFTSRNGIEAFLQRMQVLEIPRNTLNKSNLCAVGKDAELLLDLGLKVSIIPCEPSPQGIVDELAKITDIHQQSILVPVPEVVGIPEPNIVPNFIASLKQLGMKVTRVPAYMTRCLDKNLYEIELNLISTGKIDVIAFSSSAEIAAFLSMFEEQKDYEDCLIACFGPYTANNAKRLGLNVSIVPEDYSSFAEFVRAISREGERERGGDKEDKGDKGEK